MKALALLLLSAAVHAAPAIKPKTSPKVDPRCAEWNATAYSKNPKITPNAKQTAIKNLELYQCPLTFNQVKTKPKVGAPEPKIVKPQ